MWILLGSSLLTVVILPTRATQYDYSLFGSASNGWGFTADSMTVPGPALTVALGDVVNLTLTSQDGATHRFFVDYNGNHLIDAGEPASPPFSGTINYQFNATTAGAFTYFCAFHPYAMHGAFVVVSTATPDVAVTNMEAEKQFVGKGQTVKINVTVANNGNVDETFNVTAYRIGGTVQLTLTGNASLGWNGTNPGPAIAVNLGDTVALTFVSLDGLSHQFFVDYNGNITPDVGEPTSPVFSSTTTCLFVANVSGTFSYFCAFHPGIMHGTFTVDSTSTATEIAVQTVSPPLEPAEVRVLTLAWSTAEVPFANYTLSAVADTVVGETNTTNNNFTDGVVTLTILGDLNGDFAVNSQDLLLLATAYGSSPIAIRWNPYSDIDENGVVGLSDLVLLALHYAQHYP